jgi:hypothetical protein
MACVSTPGYASGTRRPYASGGQALQASQGTIGDPPAKLAVQTEQKDLEERNAANNRMCAHTISCSVCNPRATRIPPSK